MLQRRLWEGLELDKPVRWIFFIPIPILQFVSSQGELVEPGVIHVSILKSSLNLDFALFPSPWVWSQNDVNSVCLHCRGWRGESQPHHQPNRPLLERLESELHANSAVEGTTPQGAYTQLYNVFQLYHH